MSTRHRKLLKPFKRCLSTIKPKQCVFLLFNRNDTVLTTQFRLDCLLLNKTNVQGTASLKTFFRPRSMLHRKKRAGVAECSVPFGDIRGALHGRPFGFGQANRKPILTRTSIGDCMKSAEFSATIRQLRHWPPKLGS